MIYIEVINRIIYDTGFNSIRPIKTNKLQITHVPEGRLKYFIIFSSPSKGVLDRTSRGDNTDLVRQNWLDVGCIL